MLCLNKLLNCLLILFRVGFEPSRRHVVWFHSESLQHSPRGVYNLGLVGQLGLGQFERIVVEILTVEHVTVVMCRVDVPAAMY